MYWFTLAGRDQSHLSASTISLEDHLLLIAFGGLPGTGKTTLAKAVAKRCSAVYLRIDSIERAIRTEVQREDIGPTAASDVIRGSRRTHEWTWWHRPRKASLRMHVVVNFPHDPFRPLNRSSDHRIGSRTPLRSTKQVVSGFQVPRHEDSGNNRQHAFAALVHVKELIIFAFCSPTYQPAILARDQPTLRVFRGV